MMGGFLSVKGSKFKLNRKIEDVSTFVSVSPSLDFLVILQAFLTESVAPQIMG